MNELSFISSEVGRSRAWVRLALNTGQMCSYLGVLIHDTHILKDYYKYEHVLFLDENTFLFLDGNDLDL